MKKKPGWLGYIGDYTTQLGIIRSRYKDPYLNNQYFHGKSQVDCLFRGSWNAISASADTPKLRNWLRMLPATRRSEDWKMTPKTHLKKDYLDVPLEVCERLGSVGYNTHMPHL